MSDDRNWREINLLVARSAAIPSRLDDLERQLSTMSANAERGEFDAALSDTLEHEWKSIQNEIAELIAHIESEIEKGQLNEEKYERGPV